MNLFKKKTERGFYIIFIIDLFFSVLTFTVSAMVYINKKFNYNNQVYYNYLISQEKKSLELEINRVKRNIESENIVSEEMDQLSVKSASNILFNLIQSGEDFNTVLKEISEINPKFEALYWSYKKMSRYNKGNMTENKIDKESLLSYIKNHSIYNYHEFKKTGDILDVMRTTDATNSTDELHVVNKYMSAHGHFVFCYEPKKNSKLENIAEIVLEDNVFYFYKGKYGEKFKIDLDKLKPDYGEYIEIRDSNSSTLDKIVYSYYCENSDILFIAISNLNAISNLKHDEDLRVKDLVNRQYIIIVIVSTLLLIWGVAIIFYLDRRYFKQLKFSSKVLEQQHEIIQDHYKRLREVADNDILTEVYNRAYMDKYLQENFLLGGIYIIMDIDDFKKVNDKYGHDTGDYVLRVIAEISNTLVGKNGVFARWGGEEFLIFLPIEDRDFAYNLAESIRNSLDNYKFSHEAHKFRVTMSMGITVNKLSDANYKESINRADIGLYTSKQSGKNRITAMFD